MQSRHACDQGPTPSKPAGRIAPQERHEWKEPSAMAFREAGAWDATKRTLAQRCAALGVQGESTARTKSAVADPSASGQQASPHATAMGPQANSTSPTTSASYRQTPAARPATPAAKYQQRPRSPTEPRTTAHAVKPHIRAIVDHATTTSLSTKADASPSHAIRKPQTPSRGHVPRMSMTGLYFPISR